MRGPKPRRGEPILVLRWAALTGLTPDAALLPGRRPWAGIERPSGALALTPSIACSERKLRCVGPETRGADQPAQAPEATDVWSGVIGATQAGIHQGNSIVESEQESLFGRRTWPLATGVTQGDDTESFDAMHEYVVIEHIVWGM